MQEPLTPTAINPQPIVSNGPPNMPAIMEGLAQVQDGLRTMVLNGAKMPMPRSLSNGLCVILLAIPEHVITVMEGDKPGSMTFAVDGRPVMEGWNE